MDCGPTSLRMVVKYYGKDYNPHPVTQRVRQGSPDWCRREKSPEATIVVHKQLPDKQSQLALHVSEGGSPSQYF